MTTKIEHIDTAVQAAPFIQEPAQDQERSAALKRQREENRKLRDAASELNKKMAEAHTKLTFVVDEESNRAIVKVVDAETNKVIRQIPSEDSVRVAKNISRMMGILYDESV